LSMDVDTRHGPNLTSSRPPSTWTQLVDGLTPNGRDHHGTESVPSTNGNLTTAATTGCSGARRCEVADLVPGGDHVAVLALDDLAEPGRDLGVEGLLVLADGMVLTGLGGLQHGVGGRPGERVLHGEPSTVHRTGDRPGLLDVVAVLVAHLLQL